MQGAGRGNSARRVRRIRAQRRDTYTPLAQAQVAIDKGAGGQEATLLGGPAASQFTPAFRKDVLAVVDHGLNNPSAAQVGTLQADCAALGVHGKIWPDQLTGSGG